MGVILWSSDILECICLDRWIEFDRPLLLLGSHYIILLISIFQTFSITHGDRINRPPVVSFLTVSIELKH